MTTTRPGPGRPPLPRAEKSGDVLRVSLTRAQADWVREQGPGYLRRLVEAQMEWLGVTQENIDGMRTEGER